MTHPTPSPTTVPVPLWRLAHSRTGDKGNTSNISVIAWNPECWDLIASAVTAERVASWFAARRPLQVHRYVLPGLQALNFVLEGVLDGGVNDALNLDAHGKALSFHLLELPVEVPHALAQTLPDLGGPPP